MANQKKLSPDSWIGKWHIPYDADTLIEVVIRDSKLDCFTSPWCHLVIQVEMDEKKSLGKIERMGPNFERLLFAIKHLRFDLRMQDSQHILSGTLYEDGKPARPLRGRKARVRPRPQRRRRRPRPRPTTATVARPPERDSKLDC
jgi:hypothetical protein